MAFRADDPNLVTNSVGSVATWPDESGSTNDATATGGATGAIPGPTLATAVVHGATRPVIHFDGTEILQAPVSAPPLGSLFIVMKTSDPSVGNQRVVGWGDSSVGQNGLELSPQLAGGLYGILRNHGVDGSMLDANKPNVDYEVITVTWGPAGSFMYRDGVQVGANATITSISSDPNITALTIGGPGSGGATLFEGDVLELQVYDQPLSSDAVSTLETAMFNRWLAAPNAGVLSVTGVPVRDEYSLGGGNSVIAVEAVDYNTALPSADGTHNWVFTTTPINLSSTNANTNFSATGVMEAQPNTGTNYGTATVGPELTYAVNFTSPGAYYLWVRGIGDSPPGASVNDSVLFGLDGAWTQPGLGGKAS